MRHGWKDVCKEQIVDDKKTNGRRDKQPGQEELATTTRKPKKRKEGRNLWMKNSDGSTDRRVGEG